MFYGSEGYMAIDGYGTYKTYLGKKNEPGPVAAMNPAITGRTSSTCCAPATAPSKTRPSKKARCRCSWCIWRTSAIASGARCSSTRSKFQCDRRRGSERAVHARDRAAVHRSGKGLTGPATPSSTNNHRIKRPEAGLREPGKSRATTAYWLRRGGKRDVHESVHLFV